MIPLLLGGAALSLIGGAVVSSLDTDSRIESNLNKAFDPNLPPGDRQKAYNKASKINNNRYNGESFADFYQEEADYRKWVKNAPKQRAKAIEQYANNALLSLKAQLDRNDIELKDYEAKMRQITAWKRSMEE